MRSPSIFIFVLLVSFSVTSIKCQFQFSGIRSFFSTDDEFPAQLHNFEDRTQSDIATLKEKVEKLEKIIAGLQSTILKDWNSTESGLKYRLFEERKNWENAEKYCQGYGAHLVVIENEKKNSFIKDLINDSPTADFVWIGMKTKTSSHAQSFTNFASDSPIDGCAAMDSQGVWSIRSCVQLRPFICQIIHDESVNN